MPKMHEMKRLNSNFELKLVGSADQKTFTGYGAFFGNVDSYGDVISKGAFKNSIEKFKSSGQWPAMLLQHGGWGMGSEDMMPAGVWVDISEDDNGLLVEGKLADTERGNEVYTLLKMQPRPALSGLSIGYRAVKWTMVADAKKGEAKRILEEIELYEISLVTFPANILATVNDVKSAELLSNPRKFENALRETLHLSAREAKALMAHGFKAIAAVREEQGDHETEDSVCEERAAALSDVAKLFKNSIQSLKTKN